MGKTSKSALKRFKITGKKKIFHRPVHQNHFNAKDTGEEGRDKKGFKLLPKEFKKDIVFILNK